MDDDDRGKKALELGAKGISAVVGASVGGAPGALAALALEPIFFDFAVRSWDELSEGRRRAAGFLLKFASEESGLGPEELTDRALQDEARGQLLADSLQAAVGTSDIRKVRALAKALSNGVRGDDARVDEEQLIVSGLASLEAPHIRALMHLPHQRSRPTSPPNSSALSVAGRRGMIASSLANSAGLSVDGVTSVLAELVRTGMASRDTYASERRHDRLILDLQQEIAKLQWMIDHPDKKAVGARKPKSLKKPGSPVESGYERTAFGDRCLEYLEAVPDEAQRSRADGLREEAEDVEGPEAF